MQTSVSFASATETAQAIRARTVSAVAVLEAQLERIERYNPKLNAIVTVDATGARRRAEEADAALARGCGLLAAAQHLPTMFPNTTPSA